MEQSTLSAIETTCEAHGCRAALAAKPAEMHPCSDRLSLRSEGRRRALLGLCLARQTP